MTKNNRKINSKCRCWAYAALAFGLGCKPAGQGKVTAVNPVNANSELDESEPYEQELSQGFAEEESPAFNTCGYEDRNKKNICDKLKLKILVTDTTTGDELDDDTVTTKGREKVDLSVKLAGSSSKYDEAARDYERLKIGFRSLPEKAKGDDDKLHGTFSWTPKMAATGSFDIVVRDVGRCKVETAYSKKGKINESKAELCEDLDSDEEFSEYEQTKTISYTIEKSSAEEQKDLALKQLAAQCKTGALTGIISGVPGLLSGDPNALIGVGANTLMSNLECKSAQEKIELEYENSKLGFGN